MIDISNQIFYKYESQGSTFGELKKYSFVCEKLLKQAKNEQVKKLTKTEKMLENAKNRNNEGYILKAHHEFPNDIDTVSQRLFIPAPNNPQHLFRLRSEKRIEVELRSNWNLTHFGTITITEQGWEKLNDFSTQVWHIQII